MKNRDFWCIEMRQVEGLLSNHQEQQGCPNNRACPTTPPIWPTSTSTLTSVATASSISIKALIKQSRIIRSGWPKANPQWNASWCWFENSPFFSVGAAVGEHAEREYVQSPDEDNIYGPKRSNSWFPSSQPFTSILILWEVACCPWSHLGHPLAAGAEHHFWMGFDMHKTYCKRRKRFDSGAS